MVSTESEDPQLVVIPYQDLITGSPSVLPLIEQAFNHNGLGALTVSGVPGLLEIRQRVLALSDAFASLPAEVQEKYADPRGGSAGAGWSCGVEFLEDGTPDTYKGSYFANPLFDTITEDSSLQDQFPGYLTPNVWPGEDLPDYKAAFQEAGRLIIAVGLLLTRQCDLYVKSKCPDFKAGKLERILKDSKNPKGRLLHYFPPPANSKSEQAWCTQHTDHGSLTDNAQEMKLAAGLLSAMYFKNGKPIANPDQTAGLYIRDRDGKSVKAGIPGDHIAYQMGEAMQVHSGGLLRATPHYVHAASGPEAAGVSRDTLAIFMQPNYDEPMDLPAGADAKTVGIGQWQENITFGQFSELTIKKYYKK